MKRSITRVLTLALATIGMLQASGLVALAGHRVP